MTQQGCLTPIYERARALGAEFGTYKGWYVPLHYTSVDNERDAMQQGIGIADETPNGKIFVEGAQAESVISNLYHIPSMDTGQSVSAGNVHISRLRDDHYFLSSLPDESRDIVENLEKVIRESDRFVTVTDITHGRSEFRVIGTASSEYLSKLCALDFHPSAFPPGHTAISSVAKTTQLIRRHDLHDLLSFTIIGPWSLGGYLWDTMLEAGQEWNIQPVGRKALDLLSQS